MYVQPLLTKKITPYIGSHLEPFSFIKEGFTLSNLGYMDIHCNDTNDLSGCVQKILSTQVSPINKAVTQYTDELTYLNGQLVDLSKNILTYNRSKQEMLNPNPNTNKYYDYIGNVFHPPPTIQDGLTADNYDMALKENMLYIVGSITLATLLIGSIMLASE
jgi:hypothetical protein